jgi:hypothetical protein
LSTCTTHGRRSIRTTTRCKPTAITIGCCKF